MSVHRGFMKPRKYIPSSAPAPKPEDIPLPNIPENPPVQDAGTRLHANQNYITLFNTRLHLEEIILLGIVFVLVQEGIQDELLLVILLFILFTGRE